MRHERGWVSGRAGAGGWGVGGRTLEVWVEVQRDAEAEGLLQRHHDNRIVRFGGQVRQALLGALVAEPVLHSPAVVFSAAVQRLDVSGKRDSHAT